MLRLWPLLAALTLLATVLAAPSPAGAKEAPGYLALGDSLAFGVGATDPAADGYVGLVWDDLRRSDRYRDRGLDLVNLSAPGATSADLLLPGGQVERATAEIAERIEDESSSDDNVEIITVNVGGNDVLALATPGSPCPTDPLSEACQDRFLEMLDALEDNLGRVLEDLREAAPKADIVVVDLYSPLSGRGGATETIADLAIREINAVTERAVLESEGAELASVYGLFKGNAAQLVADDNLHPSDDGHEVIAEVILAMLEDREPQLVDELSTAAAVEGAVDPPLGEGGLQSISRDEAEESNLSVLLAVVIPASVLGVGAVVGAYLAARGR